MRGASESVFGLNIAKESRRMDDAPPLAVLSGFELGTSRAFS
jgi:hypothetical protein